MSKRKLPRRSKNPPVRNDYELGLPWHLAKRAAGEHQQQQQQSHRADGTEDAFEHPDVALPHPPEEKMIVAYDPLQAMNQGSILDIQPLALASSDPYYFHMNGIDTGGSSGQPAAQRDLDGVQFTGGSRNGMPAFHQPVNSLASMSDYPVISREGKAPAGSSRAGGDAVEGRHLTKYGGFSGCFPRLTDFGELQFNGDNTVTSAFDNDKMLKDSKTAIGFASTSSGIVLPGAPGGERVHIHHPCSATQLFGLNPNGTGPFPPQATGREMVKFNQLSTADERFIVNVQHLARSPEPSPINRGGGPTQWNLGTMQLENGGLSRGLLRSGELIHYFNQPQYNSDSSSSLDNAILLRGYLAGQSNANVAVASPVRSYDNAHWMQTGLPPTPTYSNSHYLQTALQPMPSYRNGQQLQNVDDNAPANYLGSINQRN